MCESHNQNTIMAELNADVVNNEERAYVLGWMALVGDKAPDALKHRDTEWIRNAVGEYETIRDVSDRIGLKQMPMWLQTNVELGWAFIRGYFDHHGQVGEPDPQPTCKVFGDVEMLASIADFACIPTIRIGFHADNKKPSKPLLLYKGTNAIDFLGKIYDNSRIFWAKRRSQYFDLLSSDNKRVPHVYFSKTLDRAVVPTKAHASDVGYDLTIVAEHKKINDVTTMYDTGIKVRVDHGWYIEVVPRSSIVKTGYMLTNTMGVIDPSYQGNIYVALTKVDPNAPPIELPCRLMQIILRRQHHALWTEGTEMETSRRDGGFGSSG